MIDPFDMDVSTSLVEMSAEPRPTTQQVEDSCSRCGTSASERAHRFGRPIITCLRCGASASQTEVTPA